MELNNKFGSCCNCPAIMEDGRLITTYMPHKTYNYKIMNELGLKNSNEYREFLQDKAENIITNLHSTFIKNSCDRSDKRFYLDGSNINNLFDEEFKKVLSKPTDLSSFY